MSARTAVDGDGLAQLVQEYRDLLRAHQEELNRLNVYPVPDGDTGTNMALTLESVCAEVGTTTDVPAHDMASVCQAIAHGSLMGARGNSGVILSQILRGLSDTFRSAEAVGSAEVARGLRASADAAVAAVMHPVEGTILTVASDAASAAEGCPAGSSLVELLDAVATAAHASVERTPELLPVLARAGVVDAGGRGLALLFDAWLCVVDDRPRPEPRVVASAIPVGAEITAPSGPAVTADPLSPRYEVMYLLDASDDDIPGFRAAWDGLGDSIVVVGGDGIWNCHVHTDDIGAAIEAGIEVGRPSRIRVTDLHEQVEEHEADWVASANPIPAVAAVVAVATGSGVTRLLRNLGVTTVVAGGQSMNPSTQELLDAIEHTGAKSVIVLPNNKNIIPVAEQAAAVASKPAEVVPSRSVVEALAAMIEFDADATAADNAAPMRETVDRVRTGEVTRAVRDSEGECGPIAAGDWIAVTAEGIRAAEATAEAAVVAMLDEMIGDSDELLTVLVGADADEHGVARVLAHMAERHPALEVEVHDGGQPLYPYLVGVE
jgi:DAK2 domain fusion protein YloV